MELLSFDVHNIRFTLVYNLPLNSKYVVNNLQKCHVLPNSPPRNSPKPPPKHDLGGLLPLLGGEWQLWCLAMWASFYKDLAISFVLITFPLYTVLF